MLAFERLVLGYFLFFAFAAPFAHVEARRRLRTLLTACACAVGILIAAWTLPVGVRLWLPFLYIGLGYWIPVPLVASLGGGGFEAWLQSTDARLRRFGSGVPRWLAHVAEAGYLSCFPLVPATFVVVLTWGTARDAAAYWTAVLAAGYACYVTLPWLVSRPPRLLADELARATSSSVTRANVFVLGRVSHQLNTFPSGHVAVSVAAAIAAGAVSPIGGVIFGIIAAAVAIGAVAGRYHFVVDVLLGVGIGIAAAVVV